MEAAKTALVTGGSHGIGQGIAIVLAEHGYDVAITYLSSPEGAQKTVQRIEALGGRCFAFEADMGDADRAQSVVQDAISALSHLDVLVNNAGQTRFHSILTIKPEEIDHLYNLNFRGYLLAAHIASKHMVQHDIKGNIIFITSSRGAQAYPEDLVYGGLKAGIQRACESIALDLSPYGIRVNCVAPGATQVREEIKPDAVRFPLEKSIPLRRMGTPRDNGELIAFLVSDKASYITGCTIRVDGGLILPGMPEYWSQPVWLNPEWQKKQYNMIMEELEQSTNEEE